MYHGLEVFKQKRTESVYKTLFSSAVFAVPFCDRKQEHSNRCFLSGSSDNHSFHLDANRSSISACAIKQKKKIHKYWLWLASIAPILRVSHRKGLFSLQDPPCSWIISRALSQASYSQELNQTAGLEFSSYVLILITSLKKYKHVMSKGGQVHNLRYRRRWWCIYEKESKIIWKE